MDGGPRLGLIPASAAIKPHQLRNCYTKSNAEAADCEEKGPVRGAFFLQAFKSNAAGYFPPDSIIFLRLSNPP